MEATARLLSERHYEKNTILTITILMQNSFQKAPLKTYCFIFITCDL